MSFGIFYKKFFLLIFCLHLPLWGATKKRVCPDGLNQTFKKPTRIIPDDQIELSVKEKSLPSKFFQEYTPTEIANSIIPRMAKRAPIAKRGGWSPIDDAEIVLFFHAQNFERILKSGFLNMHQTGITSGDSTPSHRGQIEELLLGLQIEAEGYGHFARAALAQELAKSDPSFDIGKRKKFFRNQSKLSPFNRFRPKSAYLIVPNLDINVGDVVFKNHYGEIGALFKGSIKKRSTWTPTDSLIAHPSQFYLFTDSKVKSKARSTIWARYYFEAQIWGDLSLEDVEAWAIPAHWSEDTEIYRMLHKTKLPIRRYKVELDNRNPKGSQRLTF